MKISPDFVENVVKEAIGDDAVSIVKKLKNKKNVSEFKLASITKKGINTVRNILYRLYDKGLVSFTRKKDKKKGWYIYYWTFNTKRISELALELKIKKLEKLKERVEREKSGSFFVCKEKCLRLSFEQAMEYNYKCPECGSLLQHEDNTKKIKAMEQEIALLEKELRKHPSVSLS